jgi:hypothetical protein
VAEAEKKRQVRDWIGVAWLEAQMAEMDFAWLVLIWFHICACLERQELENEAAAREIAKQQDDEVSHH